MKDKKNERTDALKKIKFRRKETLVKFDQEPEVYLTENPRAKDYYPLAYDLIRSMKFTSLLDVGCASGDFIHLLNMDNVECYGLDISEDLISLAKSRKSNSNTNFVCTNILNDEFEIKKSIDCITCFGTAVTIQNLELLLEKFMRLEPKLIFFNDVVNVNGLDVVVGYKRQEASNFNYPYNIRCFETWRELISKYPSYSIDFKPYKMSTVLNKTDNPTRNYHSNIDGEVIQRNGMDLILRPFNIFIRKN